MNACGFSFDASLCIKCWACETSCRQWNGIPATRPSRRRVFEVVEGAFPQVKRTFVSLGCLHCDNAPCVLECPSGALAKREDGIVWVDRGACIGCRRCARACPYDIPQFVDGAMDKCDFCLNAAPSYGLPVGVPHCVTTCPTGALRVATCDEERTAYAEFVAGALARIAADSDSHDGRPTTEMCHD